MESALNFIADKLGLKSLAFRKSLFRAFGFWTEFRR
jgi:hypothetical protein